MPNNLRALATALGGDVALPDSVLAPGPGHSRIDRSMKVTPGIDRVLIYSFAGDPYRDCRDHVRRCAPWLFDRATEAPLEFQPKRSARVRASSDAPDARALQIWRETVPLQGTLAETYLANRGLQLFDGIADLRFHPACPFGKERLPCMVALYRDIRTNEPKAIHRTALTHDALKIDRKVLGPKAGCAIKLSDDAEVENRLSIGEGIETCLAGAGMYFRPVWALGDANSIATFSVLPGIESLTILVDHDVNGVGQKSSCECTKRWTTAGIEVFEVIPTQAGADMADLVGLVRKSA